MPGLDEVLGALEPGTLISVSGSAGTGKTVFSLQFLYSGALRGVKGLFISSWETPGQIIGYARSLGFERYKELVDEGLMEIVAAPAIESPRALRNIYLMLREKLEEGFQRIVLDGIATLALGVGLPEFIALSRNTLYPMTKNSSALVLITIERELENQMVLGPLSDIHISLEIDEGGTARYPRRLMHIVKARMRRLESNVLEYTIGRGGIRAYPLKLLKPSSINLQEMVSLGVEGLDSVPRGSLILVEGPSGSGKTHLLRRILRNSGGSSCYASFKGVAEEARPGECSISLPTWSTSPLQAAYRLVEISERHPFLLVDNAELVYVDYGYDAFHALLKAVLGLRGRNTVFLSINTEVIPPSVAGLARDYADIVVRPGMREGRLRLEVVKHAPIQ